MTVDTKTEAFQDGSYLCKLARTLARMEGSTWLLSSLRNGRELTGVRGTYEPEIWDVFKSFDVDTVAVLI